jgi:hypothetical protein
MICEVIGCSNESTVGIGSPVQWVCLFHFEDYIKEVSKTLKRMS